MSNMTPETIQAIHDSIQHWCRMRSDPLNSDDEPYTDHCALCKLFFSRNCEGCPIAERTERPGCERTPYWRASCEWEIANENGDTTNLLAWHDAANAEIAFLNSLLPKTGRRSNPRTHEHNT